LRGILQVQLAHDIGVMNPTVFGLMHKATAMSAADWPSAKR